MSNETRNMKSERPTDLDFCLKAYHDTKLKAHSIRRTAEDDLLNALVREVKALKEAPAPSDEMVKAQAELDAKRVDLNSRTDALLAANSSEAPVLVTQPAPKKRGRPAKVSELSNG